MKMGRRVGLVAALVFEASVATTGGCSDANVRVVTERHPSPPNLLAGMREGEVFEGWGKPDRVITAVDEKTGKSQLVWQYDQFVDTNGSKVTTSLTFENGAIVRIEKQAIPRSELGPGPEPGSFSRPRDSAAQRDME